MKYQLVLQFPANSESDFEKLIDLEDKIEAQMGSEHEVDGHDFGGGEMNLFIFTNDATDAFDKIQKIISVTTYPGLKAAFRHVEGDEYTLLWPKDACCTFSVL